MQRLPSSTVLSFTKTIKFAAIRDQMSQEKQWFVFYTKSRAEKKSAELLEKNDFEVFLPVHKVMRQWSDRKKKVEVPLFNSYLFVRDYEKNITAILQIPGIAWNVRHNGKPAVLRQGEIDIIKRFLQSGLTIEATVVPDNLSVGEKAVVIDGPLAGVTGILLAETGEDKFLVLLESINQALTVQIPKVLLRKS